MAEINENALRREEDWVSGNGGRVKHVDTRYELFLSSLTSCKCEGHRSGTLLNLSSYLLFLYKIQKKEINIYFILKIEDQFSKNSETREKKSYHYITYHYLA